ncbi:uncharacterized protein LOC100679029 isoform X2 [Nasonia vitripennis]|uniref:Uncharacterized protein n=1 Tax=Nasonia vitripennis TaxID=7425 RepID=A0A7M7T682_NASVI|nr:uncharacterized protein LOC100679029 isoform X2 [Nasonia vitripennis]
MDQDTACKSFRSTKELLGHLCLLLFISSLPRLTLATYVTGNALRVKAEYKISILNSSYDEIQTIGAFGTFDRNGVKYGSPSIIGRDYVLNATNHVLRNDELAIYAEVTEFRIIQRPK